MKMNQLKERFEHVQKIRGLVRRFKAFETSMVTEKVRDIKWFLALDVPEDFNPDRMGPRGTTLYVPRAELAHYRVCMFCHSDFFRACRLGRIDINGLEISPTIDQKAFYRQIPRLKSLLAERLPALQAQLDEMGRIKAELKELGEQHALTDLYWSMTF